MRHAARRPTLVAALLAVAAPATVLAQDAAPQPATPEACASLSADAARLACYDAAFGRGTTDPHEADRVAAQAKERAREEERVDDDLPARERARRRVGAMFAQANDPEQAAIANAGQGSLLDSRWELAKDSKLGVFHMRAYKPMLLLPAFWTSDVNRTPSSPNPDNTVTVPQDLDSIEAKYQISFKTKAVENLFGDNGDLWMAYTQSSRWQVYNTEASRPFRETNYEPEITLMFRNNYSLLGWRGRMAGLSLNHQSNGRGDPLSRSWNRIIGTVGLDRDNWALVVRPWYRIPDGSDDDNPDIEDYVGRGDAMLVWSGNGHEVSVTGRHSLRGGDRSRGSLQADWGFPIGNYGTLRGHVQVFHGYGESLIDYNHKATYVGLGISMLEWF